MSTKAVSWVIHQVRVEPVTKMVLVSIAENADEYGIAWPSQSTMARSACVSVATVKRKLKTLEESGVISVRRNRVGKHKTMNKYRLHLEKTFDLLPKTTVSASSESDIDPDFEGINLTPSNISPDGIEGVSLSPLKVSERALQPIEGVTGDTFKGVTGELRTTMEPSLNPSNNITTTESHPVFDIPTSRTKVTMSLQWRPSDHVFDQLKTMRAIDRDFAEDQLPGFQTYHMGTENRQGAFDSSFLKHVIHNSESDKGKPSKLPDDWEPDQVTIQRLRTQGVDPSFIWEAATSFSMYWRERNEARHGWNSVFYNSCLSFWRGGSQSKSLAVGGQSTLERFTDRSWAE